MTNLLFSHRTHFSLIQWYFLFFLKVIVFLIYNLKYQVFFELLLWYLCKYLLFLCRFLGYLYPLNTILHFLHILGLRNYIKIHTLPFWWFLILIDLNRLVYSWVSIFFSSLLLKNYLGNLLLYDSLVLTSNNFSVLWLLCFFTFSIVFPKIESFINLKKYFWFFVHINGWP